MTETTRLEVLSPRLAGLFAETTPARRRQLLHSICVQAASGIDGCDPLILEALATAKLEPGMQSRLEMLSSRLDERYFALQESTDANASLDSTALGFFHQARLASALVLSAGIEESRAASEALYEALMALSDSSVSISTLISKLE